MSYVDAIINRDTDRIHVVERVDGQRVYKDYPANYSFYYNDPAGKFKTIYGNPVSRFATRSNKEFRKEVRSYKPGEVWESDINPVFRCLEENYLGASSPKLHTAFFDIEVDFDPEKGYSKPDDPFNPVTAVTVYLDWIGRLVTLVIKPKGMTTDEALGIAGEFENCFLCDTEEQLLDTFMELIDDADVISGWNSAGFDVPYMIMRTIKQLSKDDTRRYCLWGQFPKERRFVNKFGADTLTFDLVGRVHMDYMDLYRKYTYEERHSYSLDAIGEYELDERKIAYEGTLDQLYNEDFKTFIDYNRQDTMLLAKLDKKLKFIDLANELAHDNTVLLATTMGAVAVTEQAIINEAHSRGMIVPNRKRAIEDDDNTQAAGAYVAHPRKGMHDWIGAIDINSLYPSAIRACNMGPETIVGQLRPIMTDAYIADKMADKYVNGKKVKGATFAAAWDGMFGSLEYTAVMNKERDTEITIDWEEDGRSTTLSAAEVYKLIFESRQPWIMSANGTIFKYEVKGVVPGLLERWYAERKELQAKKKEAQTEEEKAFWDKRQLVKKINLNSLYGAILNAGCRFFDQRIGQSTTLTGRIIARHMDAYINECIYGEYDHTGKSIIYGDTDSCYFSAWEAVKEDVEAGRMEWSPEICIALYDNIAEQVNNSFPDFMYKACHCPKDMGALIKGGRELVASKGLFIKKKRYAVMIVDLEGKRTDVDGKPGKVKAMGLDLKRADTPKVVQEFLWDLLTDVLVGKDNDHVYEKVRQFKTEFTNKKPWEKGTPKRVNNLTKFGKLEEAQGRANMPGHVRAALNWNALKRMHSDNYSMNIVDGMKTIVCKLKENPIGFTSVGYPIDELHIPNWFKELPFDDDSMEVAVIDQKVENLLGVLGWDIASHTDIKSTFDQLFEW